MSDLLKQLKEQYITPETAKEYAETNDKLAYCSDITGLSISSTLLIPFEIHLEQLAIRLGYLEEEEEDTDTPQTITEGEAYDQYDQMLDDCNPIVEVCGYEYSPSVALERLDPIAYRCGFSDFCSMLESEHNIIVE